MSMARRDTDVESCGTSLVGKTILFGVSGGIAAVDTVRIARELRRHGAQLRVVMTHSAQKIITPLAVEWATQGEVITDWNQDLSVLDNVDAILVAPATRNILAAHLHGLMNGPLLMAMSAARSRGTPLILCPSMHEDLACDEVSEDIFSGLKSQGCHVIWGVEEEGKRKSPNHEDLVAQVGHIVNSTTESKSVVITLGATRSTIDDVRFVQNTSSGATGWAIAEHLHRFGHEVTCVAGATSCSPSISLPLIITESNPDSMLAELKALTKSNIDAWVHTAAVLDYLVEGCVEGKIASLQGELNVKLIEGRKHIMELQEACKDSVRIGFKLESGIKQRDLVYRALAQIEQAGMSAVIANRLEDLNDPSKARAHLVDTNGAHWALENYEAMCEAIRTLIERGV